MNIVEKMEEKKIRIYPDSNEELNLYQIGAIINNAKSIAKYYSSKGKIANVDDYIDYVFYEYINKIFKVSIDEVSDEYKNDFLNATTMLKTIQNIYKISDLVDFLSKHYEDIFEYLKSDKIKHNRLKMKEIFIKMINKYLSNSTKHQDIIKYLIEEDIILILDNISMFKKYKFDILRKLAEKDVLDKVNIYRYDKGLNFLKQNEKSFKSEKDYADIINLLIDNVLDKNVHIYEREKRCAILIEFLKNIKDVRVRKIMKVHSILIKEKIKELEKKGVVLKYNDAIDLRDSARELRKCFENKDINDYSKMIDMNTVLRKDEKDGENKRKLLIETIGEVDIGFTAALFGEDPYYASIRKMQVEAYIEIFNRFFYRIAAKKMGFRRIEKLLNGLIKDVFDTLDIEYSEREMKEDIKSVIYALKIPYNKYTTKTEKNHNYYVNSFYIISYMEKLLRKLDVAINEDELYIAEDKITLAPLLEESNEKLKTIVGENLFKWMKYYLCTIIREEKNGTSKKMGSGYRNLMGHYRNLQATATKSIWIHNIVVYLFFNLIEGIHLNVLDFPSEKTEKIVEKQMLKDDSFDKYIEEKIGL